MTDWRDKAECLTEDPESFFPNARIPYVQEEQIANAKTICGRCKSAEACLEYALTTGQDAGIWGGLDEKERRKLARKRGIIAVNIDTDTETAETSRSEQ